MAFQLPELLGSRGVTLSTCRHAGNEVVAASPAQMRALVAALTSMKFRQQPFEWVYEGYRPLLLPHVMASRSVPLATCWRRAHLPRRWKCHAHMLHLRLLHECQFTTSKWRRYISCALLSCILTGKQAKSGRCIQLRILLHLVDRFCWVCVMKS